MWVRFLLPLFFYFLKSLRSGLSVESYAIMKEVEQSMQKSRNYQKELEKILDQMKQKGSDFVPQRLLLHSCCAPCSSYCMEYLREYFRITVFYYNPNITEREEYRKRVQEEIRLIEAYNRQAKRWEEEKMQGGDKEQKAEVSEEYNKRRAFKIEIIEGDYEPSCFLEMAKGLENCAEGGERCFRCYELRLRKTAELAKQKEFDYFTTTLTISPLKNAAKLNEIGERLAEEWGIMWLLSDFKKRGGYQRSIELSKEYNLYRQDYCGCVYSKRERQKQQFLDKK